MRYELADDGWAAIKPMLPDKPRGVPRVNDRRVLNGIFWVLRSGAPWRDLPNRMRPTAPRSESLPGSCRAANRLMQSGGAEQMRTAACAAHTI